ncbi:RHTO0S10e03906g1_1 [Rhodotorula toruloides]|uniref:RHTO0S10e03906g1_1 n=1 Tax=Rhodotorula toruloides TaxID=5286 RepID=A0A061B662_RHOTO|nr:RHTO0S10e03906g1_1 [Rhodotorula toruloides]
MPLLQQEQPQPTGGWCDCLGESRRRVPRGQYHPPQFNLIVDPRLMAAMQGQTSEEGGRASRRGRQKRRKKRRHPRSPLDDQRATDSSSSSDSDGVNSDLSSGEEDPWTARSSSSSNPRRSLLSHVLLDTTWRQARSWAKKVAVADAVCAVGWGGVAGWAVTGGKRCPAGGLEGYCNLYNTALAFSFLLSASFVASFALDCFDLSRTKVSPRHRQQRLRDGVV